MKRKPKLIKDVVEAGNLPLNPEGLRRYADAFHQSVGRKSRNMFDLGYQWEDKPHRHVYAMAARIRAVADLMERAQKVLDDQPPAD